MKAKDKFRIHVFNIIIVKLIVEMEKRNKAYSKLNKIFNFHGP